MNALVTLGIVIYSIVCILLILLIIIQGGKAEGLFSSAQANVLGSQRGDALTKATRVLAAVFILGALFISMAISAQKTAFENVSETNNTTPLTAPEENLENTNDTTSN
ncbi:preprotein translocase subunit SecG [Brachyspira aalborgi]|uniref:Protein-export membrane protein SecG n=1 Tax=Brachyspira aalborgi TaxID=29522 RepID=A0A5C8EG19_9SPIR|nr:preprotein translocase subunit SecG [Brachyspira aalborgi]TXJ36987.1 preprotein translocase subunit SecG [Brachyspira aalborgi]